MRKRPRISLSLIVAETVRATKTVHAEPPVLHLVAATGRDLREHAVSSPGEDPADFIWDRVSDGLDTIQQFTRCRDWVDVLSVQRRWAERMQADYAAACALLTGAAIRIATGAPASPAAP